MSLKALARPQPHIEPSHLSDKYGGVDVHEATTTYRAGGEWL